MLADLFGVLIQVDADLDGGVGGGVRGVVTSSVWHAEDGDFVPGAELICSDRQFNLWTYSATHSPLLFHSEQMPNGEVRLPTAIEVLFKPIEARVEGASRKRPFWPSTSGVTQEALAVTLSRWSGREPHSSDGRGQCSGLPDGGDGAEVGQDGRRWRLVQPPA